MLSPIIPTRSATWSATDLPPNDDAISASRLSLFSPVRGRKTLAKATKSSFLATQSVSQARYTIAPLLAALFCVATTPSLASLPARSSATF